MEQPEALRLADALSTKFFNFTELDEQAASELRRLHEVNAELLDALKAFDELMRNAMDWPDTTNELMQMLNIVEQGQAAIAKATGENK